MKISCKISEDLLPLYLDDSCSEDSRAALEEHLKECPSCQAKLNRMKKDITDNIRAEKSAPGLAAYARKVKKHRIRIAVLAVSITIIVSAVLALSCLAIKDMYNQTFNQESPYRYLIKIEEGTYNLTSGSLETSSEEIGQYVFYTNNTQIEVKVQKSDSAQGKVMLWNTTNEDSFIQIADVNEKTETITFSSLSASNRYKITCENLAGAAITVSEGRTISFWNSLKSVLGL